MLSHDVCEIRYESGIFGGIQRKEASSLFLIRLFGVQVYVKQIFLVINSFDFDNSIPTLLPRAKFI